MVSYKENGDGITIHVPDNLQRAIIGSLLAVVLGGGGYGVVSLVAPVRYDAWTKTQDDERHAEIQAELETLRAEVKAHNQEAQKWKFKIISNQEHIKMMENGRGITLDRVQ